MKLLDYKTTMDKIDDDTSSIIKTDFLIDGKSKTLGILVDDREDNRVYLRSILKKLEKFNLNSKLIEVDKNYSHLPEALVSLTYNHNIDKILLLLDKKKVKEKLLEYENLIQTDVLRRKDIDNYFGNSIYKYSCTVEAIISILKDTTELSGKNVVIINRSDSIGLPLANELLNKDCTITICHSKTENLNDHTMMADIIVSACKQPRFIKSIDVAFNCIFIDVSTNINESGKLCGDLDLESFEENYIWDKFSYMDRVGAVTTAVLINRLVN